MGNTIYDRVTQQIIAEMEAGSLPWERPWSETGSVEAARNATSGRRYRGINVLLLWDAVDRHGFSCNRWLTFNQAREHTGGVRKGSRGSRIVFATHFIPKEERKRIEVGKISAEEARRQFHLRNYSVFNLDQCREVPQRMRPESGTPEPEEQQKAVEALMAQSGAEIRIGGSEAFYHHTQDYIVLPHFACFEKTDDFYATALHELTHWTGHRTRLKRKFGPRPPHKNYVTEEMIAELGAAFLCAEFGIRPRSRHSDYLAHWLAVMRADSRAIFSCAGKASDAADFLLSFTEPEEERMERTQARAGSP